MLELTNIYVLLSDFVPKAVNTWCATVGTNDNSVVLYENDWTDERRYICEFECK